jgi:D-amino peptidase
VRFLISVDIEGVAGVVNSEETRPGTPDFERARRLMTGEANAAVRGVLAAEPDAHVTVADSHGTYRNLLPDLVDRRARLIRGKPRRFAMMEGVDEDVDGVLLVGYHGRAGTAPSVLAHTFSDAIADVRLGGVSVGEIGLNAALAGHFAVPVLLVTGDTSVHEEVTGLLPQTATVVVKRALGQQAAESVHPEEACRLIAEAAEHAVSHRADGPPPFVVETPVELEIDLSGAHAADRALTLPRLTRRGTRTVACSADDVLDAFRTVRALVELT